MNSTESEAPRPNFLEYSYSAIFILDATSECDESDESLYDSDDLSSEDDFEKSECEVDSNFNYFDEPFEGS